MSHPASKVFIVNKWIIGARPRTLPAAVVPVVVGTAVAAYSTEIIWWRAAFALIVALSIQIATNYANDYSDGIRGTDDKRVGPVRLVASGMASATQVKQAAYMAFGVGAIAGVVLAAVTSWWLVLVGAAAIAAGWFYTGGSKPYGYRGFGELAVFIFFGVVAVCGSQYVQQEQVTVIGYLASIAVGLLAVALLVVNNLRDRTNDALAGKRTLAVWLGDLLTRRLYVACTLIPFTVAIALAFARPWVLLALLALPLAGAVNRPVIRGANGRELIAVLQGTGRLQLVFGALFAIGLYL